MVWGWLGVNWWGDAVKSEAVGGFQIQCSYLVTGLPSAHALFKQWHWLRIAVTLPRIVIIYPSTIQLRVPAVW